MVYYKRKDQVPVDKGWAWVVLAASFIGLFFMSIIYLNGIFQVVFLEVFQRDKFTTSWIFSLNSSLLSFTGPLASFMNQRLGPRVTVIIGSIVGTVGFVLASFAQTFVQIFLSYGVVVGVGLGIAYLPCAVTVGFYFERYRNVAFGLINTAVGLATMILSPLITWANEFFGWRGSMLVLGALYLQLCVVGAVLRPVQMDASLDDIEEEILNDQEMVQIIEEAEDSGSNLNGRSSNTKLTNGQVTSLLLSSKSSHLGSVGRVSRISYRGSASRISRKSALSRGSLAYPGALGSALDVKKSVQNIHASNSSLITKKHLDVKHRIENKHITSLFDISTKNNITQSRERMTCSEYDLARRLPRRPTDSTETQQQLLRNPSPGPSSHRNPEPRATSPLARHYRTTSECSQADTVPNSVYSSHIGPLDSTTDIPGGGNENKTRSCCSRFFSCNSPTFRLFKNVSFILYAIMNLVVCIAVAIVYQHLPDYAMLHGANTADTATLLMLIGISNCASRFITGLAINTPEIDPVLVQFGSNGIVGMVFFFMPLLVQTFAGQATFAVMFGFYANCYVALLGPITILIAGLENLSDAYAILLIMCGTGFLIGPPIAGAIYDITLRFEYSFILAGVFFILGAIIMMPIPVLLSRSKQYTVSEEEPDQEKVEKA